MFGQLGGRCGASGPQEHHSSADHIRHHYHQFSRHFERTNGVRVWQVATLLQTWVVIFFLRGGFLTTPDSAGSMAQRDNRRLDMHYLAAGATRRCPVQ
jgi:hypothetical protein